VKLIKLGDQCSGGSCPTVYLTDRDTVVVQGYMVEQEEAAGSVSLPAGESLVEVPRSLLVEAARYLPGR
jgi:hypothetical protein